MDGTSADEFINDTIFEDILKSIGVFEFDGSAVAAIEEAVSRFTIDLLCDAKDYSTYCGKPAVDEADARLAIETCESNLHKIEDRKIFLRTVKNEINRKSLIDLLNVTTVTNKYSHTPSDIANNHRSNNKLLSRTCTLEYGR
jgi:histone H3/H4